jgi:hypothetical protein
MQDLSGGAKSAGWFNWLSEVDILIFTHHAHAFPTGDQGRNADEEANGREGPPATRGGAEGQDDSANETTDDTCHAETTSKSHSGTVAVADGVANEVWMGLMAERSFDRTQDLAECGRVGGGGQDTEQSRGFTV